MTRFFRDPSADGPARPRSWPPTTHDAPTLWERAKAMFAVMLATIRSAAALALRPTLARAERRDLLARLVPLEMLARILLMIEAATFLLMTPEGARLRRETPKRAPPAAARSAQMRTLPPGWHTIAAMHPRTDPRVVEREQRAALARRAAAAARAEAARASEDPAGWACRFRVLGHFHPSTNKPARRPPHRRARVWIASLDPAISRAPARTPVPHASPAAEPATHVLARRIEALSRILADPGPAIRRLARRLAALPAAAITPPHLRGQSTDAWWHGSPEAFNACALAGPLVRALIRAVALNDAAPPPEPG